MASESMRSSDRVYLELPIVLAGTDANGREFVEETKTLVVGQRGAKIISRHTLAPQQRLRIRCVKTERESDLRIVGPIGGDEEGCYYGVEVLEAGTDFWGVNFPLLTTTGRAASRLLLECTRCHSQEVVHLDVFELEVLLANECLMRSCARCTTPSIWTSLALGSAPSGTSGTGSTARHFIHERKDPRINLKVDVCIRHPVYGDDVAVTENVSRGGLRFRSCKVYPVSTLIEAALPYVPGAANIFAPARIVYKEDLPAVAIAAYGVAYVPTQMASSLTGMRISTPG